MIRIVCDAFGTAIQVVLALIYQYEFQQHPPTNWIYVLLLALLNIFAIILWWMIRGFITDVKASIKSNSDQINRVDRRLIRIETKLEIENEDEDV